MTVFSYGFKFGVQVHQFVIEIFELTFGILGFKIVSYGVLVFFGLDIAACLVELANKDAGVERAAGHVGVCFGVFLVYQVAEEYV